MLVDPLSLIGQTVDNLEMLSALLVDESDERVYDASRLTHEVANCKAAAGLCNALVPRLKTAAEHIRSMHALELAYASPLQRSSANCDEFKELI
jgi:ADP-ribosylglycohydrolase